MSRSSETQTTKPSSLEDKIELERGAPNPTMRDVVSGLSEAGRTVAEEIRSWLP